jgi:hypothetical protein
MPHKHMTNIESYNIHFHYKVTNNLLTKNGNKMEYIFFLKRTIKANYIVMMPPIV